MKNIFVIGNIGSGKSTFCKMLQEELEKLGRAVANVDLDKISVNVSRNKKIIEKITAEFGHFDSREDLAQIVFKDKETLDRLTDIVHPMVYAQMVAALKNNEDLGADYTIVEETAYSGKNDKFAKHADILVCVICDDGIRQARCIEKGVHLVDFAQRTSLQMSQIAMMEDADIIINNNNDAQSLREKVINFIESF